MPPAPLRSVGRAVVAEVSSFVEGELTRRKMPWAVASKATGRTKNAISVPLDQGRPLSMELSIDLLELMGYRLVIEDKRSGLWKRLGP